jgi:hypothetical protein
VMVRRFYPDRIVPHEGQGHAPVAAPVQEPLPTENADATAA